MATLYCFHTSPASRNVLRAANCHPSSMEFGNGGLPGTYFMSIDEKHYSKDPALYNNFIAQREKQYGKFMHQFTLDTSRPHFSKNKLTITKEILRKMNAAAKFTNDIDAVWHEYVEWKKVKNDYEFLSRMIPASGFDIKFWLKALSSVADFIAEDDPRLDLPADGVVFIDVKPERIITL